MDARLIAFVGISLLLSVTPGPDMAVVTKNALAHGRRGVILTTTGIAVALAVWITATAVGLSALLRTSAELLFVLKIIGAAYLAYLGLSTLIESRRKPVDLLATAPPPGPATGTPRPQLGSSLPRCRRTGARSARRPSSASARPCARR